MKPYLNKNNMSNIESYEIGDDNIVIKFYNTNYVYKYSYKSAGRIHVEEMKKLALKGCGLNSYINLNCKYKYE